MFEGTLYSALLEAKEKINFDALQFPIYRKSEQDKEWYRFDSTIKMISVRNNQVKAIGIAENLPEDVFIRLYSFNETCLKDEFDSSLSQILQGIENI